MDDALDSSADSNLGLGTTLAQLATLQSMKFTNKPSKPGPRRTGSISQHDRPAHSASPRLHPMGKSVQSPGRAPALQMQSPGRAAAQTPRSGAGPGTARSMFKSSRAPDRGRTPARLEKLSSAGQQILGTPAKARAVGEAAKGMLKSLDDEGVSKVLECLFELSLPNEDLLSAKEAVASAVQLTLRGNSHHPHRCPYQVCRLIGGRKAYVFEVDTANSTLFLQTRDESGILVEASSATSRGISGLTATSASFTNVTHASLHPSFDALVDDRCSVGGKTLGAALSVPLCAAEGTVIGVVTVLKGSESSVGFTAVDESCIKLVSPFIATCLQSACFCGRKTMLCEVTKHLTSQLETQQLCTAISSKACELFRCDASQVFVVDGKTGNLYLANDGDLQHVTEEKSLVNSVAISGDPLNVQCPQQHMSFNPSIDQPKGVPVVKNATAWPICNSKGVIGVLELVNRHPLPFAVGEDTLQRLFLSQLSESMQSSAEYTHTLDSFNASLSTQAKYHNLLEVAESLAVYLEGDSLVRTVLHKARTLVNAERSALFLIDSSTNELVSHVADGTDSIRFPLNHGIAGHVVSSGVMENIKDAYSDPRFNTDIDKQTNYKTRNILCVPIQSGKKGQIIGVAEIINKVDGSFTPEDEELFKAFSIFCGLALTNSNLYSEAREQQRKSSALLEVVMALTSDTQVTPLITTIMHRARELIGADRASLFIVDPKKKELRTQVADGEQEIIVPSKPSSIAGYVAETREDVIIKDAYTDPKFDAGVDQATGYRTHSVIAIPVLDENGEVVAVTEMLNKRAGTFQDADIQLLKAFTAFCGKSLSSVQANYSASRKKIHIRCVMSMFIDLELFNTFGIDPAIFVNFMHELARSYNTLPYHSFSHAVDVTQFIYTMYKHSPKLQSLLGKLEVMSLLISALSHDIDHGGLNNSFQVNAHTPLALLFSGKAVMETYHCSRCIAILSNESFNILAALTEEQRQMVWGYIIPIILSTDMAAHSQLLTEFAEAATSPEFTCESVEQRKLLLKMLMKCGDTSNVCRPFAIARKWASVLMNEFFRQGEIEKKKGMATSALLDLSGVTSAQMQLSFMNSVAYPQYELLTKFLPDLKENTLDWTKLLKEQSPSALAENAQLMAENGIEPTNMV
eukprot:m51a1_g14752 putative 3 5 -cyclic nucleotide phosphodiesterase family protein (1143) ;mRNA; r:320606-325033